MEKERSGLFCRRIRYDGAWETVYFLESGGGLWLPEPLLREILELCLKKNPAVRVVVNAVTLETVGEANACFKELPFTEVEIVQLQVSLC